MVKGKTGKSVWFWCGLHEQSLTVTPLSSSNSALFTIYHIQVPSATHACNIPETSLCFRVAYFTKLQLHIFTHTQSYMIYN